MFLIEPIRNFYGRFERPISSFSLIFGFVFDAVTLKRVDTLWENLWILGHLVIVGFFIILVHAHKSESGAESNPSRAHFWYVNILQFFFGGLLSTYLVFYFRSGDIFVTWPFIFLLAIAFVANESLKRHFIRVSFQISLFYLSIYLFVIFLLPVLIHKINAMVFLLSGGISLVFISSFTAILFHFEKKFRSSKKLIAFLVLTIFTIMNLLYFTNLIPPIPLSLKDAGVYHSIHKTKEGNYEVTYEPQGIKKYFQFFPDFHEAPNMPVYAYSAVFAPKYLNVTIKHEWQKYNSEIKRWQTVSVIELPLVGGREDGFRTYSSKSNLAEGKWRVNVKTLEGHTIGRLRFDIIQGDEPLKLQSMVK